MSNIGNKIKELRIEHGMTQEDLGKILGVQKSAIQKYESGSVNLRSDKIRLLAKTFKIFPRFFIYENTGDFFKEVFGELPVEDNRANKFDDDISKFVDLYIGEDIALIFHTVSELNQTGKNKAIEYIRDLNKIPEYKESRG